MEGLASSESSDTVIKVEIVNQTALEDQIRNKLLLAMASATGALLIEKGAEWLARTIMNRRRQKAIEQANAPKKD